VLGVLAFALIVGCHRDAASPAGDLQEPLAPSDMKSPQDVPMKLWSPARRAVNASYFFMIAEYETLRNHYGIAKQFYEDAYNLDPNAYLGAKWLAARAGENSEEVMLQAKKMVLLYPKNPDIRILHGKLLAGRGRFDEAAQSFEQAISLEPRRLEPYLGLAAIRRSQGDLTGAIEVTRSMLDVEPSFSDGWALLAKLYLMTEQHKKALAPAKRSYDLQSNNPEHVHLYALALELNGFSKKAVNLYEVIFRLNPGNDELITRMVSLYKQIGDLDDALKLLKDAEQQLGEVTPGIRLQMVFIYWELKRYQQASELLNDLARRFPESDRILYMAGLGREKISQPQQALQQYRKISKESQFFVHAAFRSIQIHRQAQSWQQAEKLARQVIATDHERVPDFYMVLANIHADQKNFQNAVDVLKEALAEYPERMDLKFLVGVNLERAGKIDQCIQVMRDVIKQDPNHAGAYNYLGYLFAERGENLDEAERLIKRALELKPNDGYFLDSLGWVYYQQERYEKALEVLNKANRLAPNEGVILEHIGDCYKALGQATKALSFYEQATKAKVDERDHDRIFEKYRKMKADVETQS
jgi:tetratricopeptide (TPR) repeat protein